MLVKVEVEALPPARRLCLAVLEEVAYHHQIDPHSLLAVWAEELAGLMLMRHAVRKTALILPSLGLD